MSAPLCATASLLAHVALSLMSVAYLLFGVDSRLRGVSNSATTPSEITMIRSESATVLRLREHRQDNNPRIGAAVSCQFHRNGTVIMW